jgi:4'-phosphopantetheinyl transferase EntD
MIESILPPTAAVASRLDDREPARLFPEEEAVIGGAVPKRRAEFATGRACAREALEAIGFPPSPILQGDRGEPAWPEGVVGSITHCAGYRASAVARDEDLRTLGIDAEPNEPLPHGLLPDIALPEEREALKDHSARDPGVCWDRLLFCAKEAIYKAWFPLTEAWLGFDDARVRFDIPNRAFTGDLLVPGPTIDGRQLGTVAGKWSARDGVLLTAVVIPATGSSATRTRA